MQYRLEFEALITAISATFINIPTGKIDEDINSALRAIGEFCEADRSFLVLLSEEPSRAYGSPPRDESGLGGHPPWPPGLPAII